MVFPQMLSLFASATFLASFVLAGNQCYYLNGQPAGGVYRCDNSTSGESSCCNAGQICYSNGVCQAGPEDHATDWLRVGCTDSTWSSPGCLKQCTFLVPESSAGIRPCGGILTSDQYCCDTQGKGPGSLACCSNSSDIFAVNPIPSIIATIPLNPTQALSSSASSSTPAFISFSSSNSDSVLSPITTLSPPSTTTSASAASASASANTTSTPGSVSTSTAVVFTLLNTTTTSAATSAATSTTSTKSSSSSSFASSTSASSSTQSAAARPSSAAGGPAARFDTLGMSVSFVIAVVAGCGLVYGL